jgi:hypothetical protein
MPQSAVVRRKLLNAIALLALMLFGCACRVDLVVGVTMAEDGSGTISVEATADAEVVESAPGLAQDLRIDDLAAAGWTVTGPAVTDEGGITMLLSHTFANPTEATTLLASLNGSTGPFQRLELTRAEDERAVTYSLTGVGRVDSGLAVFTDPELLAAVGAAPYAEQIAAAGLSPTQAVGITLRADLPGTVEESSADPEGEELSWVVPLDGTSVPISASSRLSLDGDAVWSIVATTLLVALVVWLVAASAFIAFVVRARRRRARARASTTPRSGTGVVDRSLLERTDSTR